MRQTFRTLAEAQPDRYLVLDARQSPDQIAAAIRVQVAELLSGQPLQQLAQNDPQRPRANGSTVAPEDLTAPGPHRPHAQTGSTPQLHP